MAVESKLAEIAVSPSGEIASARTGPPWPRNCANAASLAGGPIISTKANSGSAPRLRRWIIRDNGASSIPHLIDPDDRAGRRAMKSRICIADRRIALVDCSRFRPRYGRFHQLFQGAV